MSKAYQRAKKFLPIVAISLSCLAISGCVDSVNYLAGDSRLPKSLTLPPGLTRADVVVVRYAMEPTRRGADFGEALYHADIKLGLYNKKFKKLAEVRGKTVRLGNFVLNIVDCVPEITGYKAQIDSHGNRMPYFYFVDDPALKRKLLDEYEDELLHEKGIDYPTLRKELLDENGAPMSDH